MDRGASDRNLAKMAAFFRNRPARLRPHFKNYKCVTLATRQLAAGAAGMTCAKVGEAEVLVEHGFQDVLIANQVVRAAKMARLARLATQARVSVAIDHWDQAAEVSQAAMAAGTTVQLLVEVDIGMGRCGVQPGKPALELVQRLVDLPGVGFAGLQAFPSHACTTCNLYRELVVHEHGRVVEIWPIEASGRLT